MEIARWQEGGPKPKFIDVPCAKEDCTLYGVTGKGNVIVNGTYMTKIRKVQKYICRNCGRVFCGMTNSAFYDLRTEEDKILTALKMILKAMSLRGVRYSRSEDGCGETVAFKGSKAH